MSRMCKSCMKKYINFTYDKVICKIICFLMHLFYMTRIYYYIEIFKRCKNVI